MVGIKDPKALTVVWGLVIFRGNLMKILKTAIAIDAAPSVVWEILMDFPDYPDWNPFIRSIQGQAIPGAQLVARLQPPGGQTMTFKPTVLVVNLEQEFCWRGKLIIPGLFDGEHRFQLEPLADNRVQFIHSEQFSGLLVPLLANNLDTNIREGFEAMNQALKARADELSAIAVSRLVYGAPSPRSSARNSTVSGTPHLMTGQLQKGDLISRKPCPSKPTRQSISTRKNSPFGGPEPCRCCSAGSVLVLAISPCRWCLSSPRYW